MDILIIQGIVRIVILAAVNVKINNLIAQNV
jgi:hypothetical protein